ncbi:MAG: UMP kinase [Candidatus Buchananbacteria bacterium]|jgi:uridylate kinase
MAKTLVMSLGGSLIAPDGLDINFLKKFKELILNYTKKGNRVILICGGGNTCRTYQQAARIVNQKVSDRDLDFIGIATTKLNAELVSAIFGEAAFESILTDPAKPVKTSCRIIVGAGFKPGSSSDKDAVLAAKAFGAKTVINLSNITYVYDKDPKKFKDAKPLKEMVWPNFLKLVGTKWVPGAHVPFDPVASKLAYQRRLKLVVMKGDNLNNLSNFLAERNFVGTIIS